MRKSEYSWWRKAIALILCSSILCSMLSGCGKSDTVNNGNPESAIEQSPVSDMDKQDEKESVVAETDAQKEAFEEGWNLARDYIAGSRALKSDADCDDEYNAIIAVNEELSSKDLKQDDWVIEDSLDDPTNETLDVSTRYYSDPEKEEILQAQNIVKEYEDYYQSSSNPDTFTQYFEKKGYSSEISELLPSKDGLPEIIAIDDIKDVSKFIKGGKLLLGVPKNTKEIAKKLKERYQGKNEGVEISNEELLAISELIESGEFQIEDFGISATRIVTPKYIFKQALTHVDRETMLQFALEVAPQIVSVIQKAIKDKKIDLTALQEMAKDNDVLFQQLLQGIVCSILEEAIQSGKLGDKFKNINEEQIAELAVVMVKVIITVYKGITTHMGKVELLKELLLVILPLIVNSSGITSGDGSAQLISPVYIAGSIAAALLKYIENDDLSNQKDVTLEAVDVDGFEIILPEDADENANKIKGYFSELESDAIHTDEDDIVLTEVGDSSLQYSMAA